MSSFEISPLRFVRQFTTGQRQDKINYVLIMQNLLSGLQNTAWRKSSARLDTVGLPNHNFASGAYINDSYDAYKICGEYNSSDMTYIGYAGCVAYRFKVPASYYGHYESGTLEIKSITIPISRDRFLKSGSRINIVASNSESPSSNWDVISGAVTADVGDANIYTSAAIQSQSEVRYLTDSNPLSEKIKLDVSQKASEIASKKYIYVYLSLNDYTDSWEYYNSKERRMYAIEGSAAFSPLDFLFEFSGNCEPDPDTDTIKESGNSIARRIINATAGFVGIAGITIGALWYGGRDSSGNNIPDEWENSFPVLTAITDPTDRASYSIDGDYMACADVTMGLIVASNKINGVCRPYGYDHSENPFVYVGMIPSNINAITAFPYGDTFGIGTNVVFDSNYIVVGHSSARSFRLVHFQVYDRYGWEQDVATSKTKNHTKKFTALDKYLLARFLMENGIGPGESNVAATATSPLPYTTLIPGIADYDGDSITDGLELYLMFGPNQKSLSGNHFSPWNKLDGISDYDNDGVLAAQELSQEHHTLNPWSFISNPNSVIDTYAYEFNLRNSDESIRDDDGDGLSNFSEYLISKVFGLATLSPYHKRTSQRFESDYFREQGATYLGFIFTDHDMIDDDWERKYSEYADASKFDPYRDDDDDGWDNYSEFKSGTHPGRLYTVGPDGFVKYERPTPIIKANISYVGNGKRNGKIIVEAMRKIDGVMTREAKWTLGGDSNKTSIVRKNRYVGTNPRIKTSYNTGSGSIVKGSFQVMFKVLNYESGHTENGEFIFDGYGESSKSTWDSIISDVNGELYDTIHNVKVGTIDYDNGLVDVDFSSDGLNEYRTISTEYFKTNSIVGDGYVSSLTTNITRICLADAHVNMTWNEVDNGSLGVRYFSVADRTNDGLPEFLRGDATYDFRSFIDNDGNGEYTAGEPLGCVQGISPKYDRCEFDIGMTDTISISPRFILSDSNKSDRGQTVDESIKMLLSDRTKQKDRALALSEGANTYIAQTISNQVDQVSGVDAEKDKVRIRIVRFGVNDMFAYLLGVGFGDTEPDPIVIDRTYDRNGREFICEADFLQDGEFDLDWTRLKEEVVDFSGVEAGVGDVTNMTYLAVLEGGKGHEYWLRGSWDSNTVIRCLSTPIERRFEATKHPPVAANIGICYSARPEFKWTLPNEEAYAKRYGTSYTAFNLEVYEGKTASAQNKIYESGVCLAPTQDKDGVFTWKSDLFAGDLTKLGKFFHATSNYCWRVAMYNAKFKPGTNDQWSNVSAFSTAVNGQQKMNSCGYSSIDVVVKYCENVAAGHYNDIGNPTNKFRIQVFTTRDFSGVPVSQSIVTNYISAAYGCRVNGTIRGIPNVGTYYLRAYIDSNANHKWDNFESFGMSNEPIILTDDSSSVPIAEIWIEDMDTNGNLISDSTEYALKQRFDYYIPNVKSSFGTILSDNSFLSSTSNYASVSSGLPGASLAIFENGSFAKSYTGYGNTRSPYTFSDIDNAVMRSATMKQTYVRIDDVNLSKDMTFDITFITENGSTPRRVINPKYYTVDPVTKKATIMYQIQRKNNESDTEWIIGQTRSVQIGVDDTSITVPNVEQYCTGIYRVVLLD